jgi:hypothetical protein
MVPLVSLGAQSPLWVVRQIFGWRLVRADQDTPVGSDSPLSIRDLMLATVLVATAFALARMSTAYQQEKEFAGALIIFSGLAGFISTIGMLPAGALLMKPRRFSRGLLYGGLYACGLIGVPWTVVGVLYWRWPGQLPPYPVIFGLSSLMISYAATVILAAAVARAEGYRLVWGRRGRESIAAPISP